MKYLFVILVIVGLFVFLVGPTLLNQKKCYDKAEDDIAQVNSNVMTRGWSLNQVCENKFRILSELESCVHNQNDTDKYAMYKERISNILIPYIRPLTNTVEAQQAQHDIDCSEFRTLMFSGSL